MFIFNLLDKSSSSSNSILNVVDYHEEYPLHCNFHGEIIPRSGGFLLPSPEFNEDPCIFDNENRSD